MSGWARREWGPATMAVESLPAILALYPRCVHRRRRRNLAPRTRWPSGPADPDDDGWATVSGIGSRILGAAPDFDVGSYGCRNLVTLVEKSGGFEVDKKPGGSVRIRRKPAGRKAAGRAKPSS